MLQLKFKITGLDEVQAYIEQVERATTDLEPALQEMGQYVLHGVNDNFSDEHSPDGTGWLALKPATVAIREGQGYPGAHPILRRSGTLQDSIAITTTPRSVIVGTSVPYAGFQQTGYRNGSQRVPARTFLGLPPGGETALTSILMKRIREPFRR